MSGAGLGWLKVSSAGLALGAQTCGFSTWFGALTVQTVSCEKQHLRKEQGPKRPPSEVTSLLLFFRGKYSHRPAQIPAKEAQTLV